MMSVPSNGLERLVQDGERFRTVYAGPPWDYEKRATRGAAVRHYPTMRLEEIASLPIGKLVAKDAHLHLWTTNSFLFDAREVLEAWGLEYRSCLVWMKPRLGTGNYWRVSHEFLLLGVRGEAPFLEHDRRSWMEAARGAHSEKPDEFRKLIEEVSPVPRLELFARRRHRNWTCWGNEL